MTNEMLDLLALIVRICRETFNESDNIDWRVMVNAACIDISVIALDLELDDSEGLHRTRVILSVIEYKNAGASAYDWAASAIAKAVRRLHSMASTQ